MTPVVLGVMPPGRTRGIKTPLNVVNQQATMTADSPGEQVSDGIAAGSETAALSSASTPRVRAVVGAAWVVVWVVGQPALTSSQGKR